MTPLVSVIIPCHNQGQYLTEALDSVLAQTYNNWECIIVNDGSTDKTEDVANKYVVKDNRLTYIYQQKAGPSAARNAGIGIAKGTYILPLDADDIIAPKYIELAIEAFQKNTNLSLVYCMANKFGHETGLWELKEYSFKNLLQINCIFCSAVFKKADWQKSGGYDEELIYAWEDWDFWLRILNEGSQVYKIPEVLFFYRIKPQSRNAALGQEELEIVRWKVISENLPAYQKYYKSPQLLTAIVDGLNKMNTEARNSYSYKLGNAILKPLSFLKAKLKK
jgi:glycosyltransferase involved in cell wall biosynthesis